MGGCYRVHLSSKKVEKPLVGEGTSCTLVTFYFGVDPTKLRLLLRTAQGDPRSKPLRGVPLCAVK